MPLVDFITDDLESEELDRARRLDAAWEVYGGNHARPLPTTPAVGDRPPVDDNVVYNAAGLAVDKSVAFLFGTVDQDVQFLLDEENEENPDELHLEEVWQANQKKTTLQEIGTNGGVCGHFFVRLYREGAGFDRTLPRIVNIDPAYCLPVTDVDNYRRVLGYKIQYPTRQGTSPATKRVLIEPNNEDTDPDTAESWLITTEIAAGDLGRGGRASWQQVGEPEVWPFAWSPLIDGKNLPNPNSYWGRSDLENGVTELNESMNRALSSMQRILRLHGHPKPWVAGVDASQIGLLIQGVDRIITLPDGSVLNQLEVGGDLSASIEFYRQLKAAFHEVAKNPQVDPEKLGSVGGMSGVALRILYQPLLEKTGTKHGTYGDFLQAVNARLLDLASKAPQQATIVWPDPIPVDKKEQAEAATLLKELGYSWETVVKMTGGDPEKEREQREDDPEPTPAEAVPALSNNGGFNGGLGV